MNVRCKLCNMKVQIILKKKCNFREKILIFAKCKYTVGRNSSGTWFFFLTDPLNWWPLCVLWVLMLQTEPFSKVWLAGLNSLSRTILTERPMSLRWQINCGLEVFQCFCNNTQFVRPSYLIYLCLWALPHNKIFAVFWLVQNSEHWLTAVRMVFPSPENKTSKSLFKEP